MSRSLSHWGAVRDFAASVSGVGLVVAAAVVGCLILFDNEGYLAGAIQSDSLLPAQAVWDYSTHGYALRGFQLAAVPSLIPDLLVYSAVQLASGSWRLASLAYGGLSLFAVAALGGTIVRDITGSRWRTGTHCVLLLALACIMLELPVTPASKHLLLFVPAQHGGSFILSLATLAVARQWLDRTEDRWLALLFGLVVAGVLSDRLFLVTAIVPLLAALSYPTIRKRNSARTLGLTLGCLAAGTAAALLLDLALIREPINAIDWGSVPGRAGQFLQSLRDIAVAAPLTVLLVGAVPLIALLSYPVIGGRRGPTGAAEFWWVASGTGLVATIIAIPLYYLDPASYRYASALWWWPVIWTAAALVRAAGSVRGYAFASALGGVTAVLAFAYVRAGPHAPALLRLHHPLQACLAEGERSAGLKAGLADYWLARPIAASSDWRLQVDQIDRNGAASYWGNDRFWYSHDIHDASRPPEYNFIVISNLDESAIERNYGPPDRTLECSGTTVWIYEDPKQVMRSLVSLSPILSR